MSDEQIEGQEPVREPAGDAETPVEAPTDAPVEDAPVEETPAEDVARHPGDDDGTTWGG